MHIHNRPESSKAPMTIARFSGWSSGIAWFLLFSVILSDEVLGATGENSPVGFYFCIGPLFVLAGLGFIIGIITGSVARKKGSILDDEEQHYSKNGIRYGLAGVGLILMTPLLNLLLNKLGFSLYSFINLLYGSS